ncbi:ArsR/SmtB family transcription factor [Gulosibacter faecalis]|jgi:ArsR family transcriptional regulator|uniref:ArsR/SmtB family transcription factor n=1 Tax=Gulosibacter faecalis TaxID=272240 RepID=A0ABW5UWT3_9MICO|nr:metalloregulator ArsR/SmtB family transcription factor [Gulosibacter faecalis]
MSPRAFEPTAWPGGEGEPLGRAAARTLAATLGAIADPTRLRILSLLAAHEPRPTTVTELVDELDLSQATVSHHLKQLLEAGLIDVTRSGNWNLYRADADAYRGLLRRLDPS